MGYRLVEIRVQRDGLGYMAHAVREDDGVPDDGCPAHGFDPPRDADGTLLAVGDGCRCSAYCGLDLECGPYFALTHRRAWLKALRHNGGKLYLRLGG